jgi:hypothetical protein
METESVYTCTLPVEAHMICDMLARAGIPSRVDGEFLAGAGGDLPLGNTVRVRVAPERAAEAREVIAEWEQATRPLQGEAPTPPIRRFQWSTPAFFVLGLVIGATLVFAKLRNPETQSGVDYDDDGRQEVFYYYAGNYVSRVDLDRNSDGKVDAETRYDLQGVAKVEELDEDFDGRFEWQYQLQRGLYARGEHDADGDGKPEAIEYLVHGVLDHVDYLRDTGTGVAKREHYRGGALTFAEYDADGDGVFEKKVEFDRFNEPR